MFVHSGVALQGYPTRRCAVRKRTARRISMAAASCRRPLYFLEVACISYRTILEPCSLMLMSPTTQDKIDTQYAGNHATIDPTGDKSSLNHSLGDSWRLGGEFLEASGPPGCENHICGLPLWEALGRIITTFGERLFLYFLGSLQNIISSIVWSMCDTFLESFFGVFGEGVI